ncbi:MAG: PD-(D/E)XK nuclease family protein [Evtepia gabavorous]
MEAAFADFSRLLRLLLSQYSVGTIPASLDRVTAGDAQRLGGRACKVLFLLGAEDGAIPQVAPGQGLLTDQDRLLLEDYGLTCSPRLEEKISRENTIVYTTCAQPTERLCVTWPFQGAGGGEKRPSFLVERLNRLFPAAAAQGGAAPSLDQLRAMAAGLPQVRQALSDDPLCDTLFRRLDRAAHWTRGRLSADRVAALYGEKVAMSASRMDQYQSCHFAYFLRYGLGAKDRRPAGFHAPEYGTFVHFVLETVLREVRAQGVARVSQEAVQACTARAVEDYVARELGVWSTRPPASAISSAGWNGMSGRWWTMWWRNSRPRISSRCFLSWGLVREKSSLRWRSPREA